MISPGLNDCLIRINQLNIAKADVYAQMGSTATQTQAVLLQNLDDEINHQNAMVDTHVKMLLSERRSR